MSRRYRISGAAITVAALTLMSSPTSVSATSARSPGAVPSGASTLAGDSGEESWSAALQPAIRQFYDLSHQDPHFSKLVGDGSVRSVTIFRKQGDADLEARYLAVPLPEGTQLNFRQALVTDDEVNAVAGQVFGDQYVEDLGLHVVTVENVGSGIRVGVLNPRPGDAQIIEDRLSDLALPPGIIRVVQDEELMG